MKKKAKIWLTVGAILILIGAALFTGVMTMQKWDFTKLSTAKYETNTYVIKDELKDIYVNTTTAKIELFPSANGETQIECFEQKNLKHTVDVEDGVLTVKLNDTRKWYDHIGINFVSPRIKIYLPEEEYAKLTIDTNTGDVCIPKDFIFESINISVSTGDIKNLSSASDEIVIKTSTGDIFTDNISAGSLEFGVSTGHVTVSDVMCEGDVNIKVTTGKCDLTSLDCRNLTTNGSTGNITLKNVIVTERLTAKRSTGDVKFDSCDANEILVTTDTGNVKGTLRSDKVFITETDTGKVKVPKTITGGRCEITSETGNIIIEIES